MLQQFDYADVRLTDGLLRGQLDRTLEYYVSLEEDRLLKVYRQAAGLPTPGRDLGGWYDPGAFAPGHCFGQILSALARFWRIYGSREAIDKLGRLVDGFAETLAASARPFYDGHRFRAYVYDKHVLGLTEAYRLAGIDRARQVLARATDLALPHLPEKALTRREQALRPHPDVSFTWDESYTLPENLFLAYEATGETRYLDLGRRYLHDDALFEPLARGENVLPGLHAYSHLNALSSAAKAHLMFGDERHLRAARNAWDLIEQTQSFASGGWGPDEAFVEPGRGLLGRSLQTTRKHFETPCGSYAHMKLARYLLRITSDPRYGDGLERVLYNGILAAKHMGPEGRTFYYSDYAAEARKTYHPDPWPCCAGTYPQAVADYGISAYFHDHDAVYVNLYVPSQLTWRQSHRPPVTITQETGYPLHDGHVRLTVEPAGAATFALLLRLPRWTRRKVRICVNGVPHDGPAEPGTFAEIRRTWLPRDVVELDLPLEPRVEPVDRQHPRLVATLRGPLLMVRCTAPSGSTRDSEPPHRTEGTQVPYLLVGDELYTTYVQA